MRRRGPEPSPDTAHEKAFGDLFRRNFGAVVAYAARRASAADAAEVVAETFVVAWRRFDQIPAEPQTRSWLFGVARKTLANVRRGNVRRDELTEQLAAELRAMRTSIDSDIARRVTDGRVVRDALGRLEPHDQEVLMLSAWEGLSPNEVAVALGVGPATARTRLHRARRRFRQALDDEPEPAVWCSISAPRLAASETSKEDS